MVTYTVHYTEEELARYYGVNIFMTNSGFVIPEYKAICKFTGKTIRRGTKEWVTDRLLKVGTHFNPIRSKACP